VSHGSGHPETKPSHSIGINLVIVVALYSGVIDGALVTGHAVTLPNGNIALAGE
jgi:hypothetical protein